MSSKFVVLWQERAKTVDTEIVVTQQQVTTKQLLSIKSIKNELINKIRQQ